MIISHLEIANFRKLLSVRVDLAQQTTVFVGANNSGKTSAMLATGSTSFSPMTSPSATGPALQRSGLTGWQRPRAVMRRTFHLMHGHLSFRLWTFG